MQDEIMLAKCMLAGETTNVSSVIRLLDQTYQRLLCDGNDQSKIKHSNNEKPVNQQNNEQISQPICNQNNNVVEKNKEILIQHSQLKRQAISPPPTPVNFEQNDVKSAAATIAQITPQSATAVQTASSLPTTVNATESTSLIHENSSSLSSALSSSISSGSKKQEKPTRKVY